MDYELTEEQQAALDYELAALDNIKSVIFKTHVKLNSVAMQTNPTKADELRELLSTAATSLVELRHLLQATILKYEKRLRDLDVQANPTRQAFFQGQIRVVRVVLDLMR
jgi:hypothetical protein